MKLEIRDLACRLLSAVSWVYLIFLFSWVIAYLTTGDRYGYLALFNLLAVYLFFLLPLVLLAALICRRAWLGGGFALGLLAFLWLWGGQVFPGQWLRGSSAQAGQPTLSVMTYNVLAHHRYTQPILDTIRLEDPDVVLIQELNYNLADALLSELGEEYPYQIHDPANSAYGIGTISKYPIRRLEVQMPHRWIGGPQFMELEWQGRRVGLVNIHMYPTTRIAGASTIENDFRIREEQARLLADYAAGQGPLILGGDANSVPLSNTYRILTSDLKDAWAQAGFGLGHTFPGSTIPGSDRPRIGNVYVPPWLARIDYVFHTTHWQTVNARLAHVDGVSDHRGVVATLKLVE